MYIELLPRTMAMLICYLSIPTVLYCIASYYYVENSDKYLSKQHAYWYVCTF